MLVLTRKIHETIVIGGNIRITMTAIRGKEVRVAIEAPRDVPIHREELLLGPHATSPDEARRPSAVPVPAAP
jgi:carbon storage regulator